jgi:hypothetical protein
MASAPPKLAPDAFPAWIDGLDAFLLDCDGGSNTLSAVSLVARLMQTNPARA